MPFLLPRSLVCTAPSTQGHILAAALIGGIYNWGQGVAIDYPRALAAYKIAAEAGDAVSQHQLGFMHRDGLGVAQDNEEALRWLEKAAAQDCAHAIDSLGQMYFVGKGVAPSLRRAREYFARAIELGDSQARVNMQNLTRNIANVT